jgi:hypothetical protein
MNAFTHPSRRSRALARRRTGGPAPTPRHVLDRHRLVGDALGPAVPAHGGAAHHLDLQIQRGDHRVRQYLPELVGRQVSSRQPTGGHPAGPTSTSRSRAPPTGHGPGQRPRPYRRRASSRRVCSIRLWSASQRDRHHRTPSKSPCRCWSGRSSASTAPSQSTRSSRLRRSRKKATRSGSRSQPPAAC